MGEGFVVPNFEVRGVYLRLTASIFSQMTWDVGISEQRKINNSKCKVQSEFSLHGQALNNC
jgi:hypothetical protein